MKKYSIFIILFAAFISCTEKMKNIASYGQAGQNACEYVREQVPELKESIESIEAIGEDSLLGDSWLAHDQLIFARAGREYAQGILSRKDYEEIIEKYAHILTDINNSWLYGIVVNDSLRKLEKYQYQWRKVYIIRVTMKSSVTKEVRVLMDNDGITPRMTEKQFSDALEKWDSNLANAYSNL